MDFALDDHLDLLVEEGEFLQQINGETTLITSLFTDNGERSYWLDINDSSLWMYYQSKLTEDARRDIHISINQVTNNLVAEGLYEEINNYVYILNDKININIECYSNNEKVVNKTFTL